MRKKYNDNSKFFKDWTTKKLKQEAIALDEMINVAGCYGCKDVMMYDGVLRVLADRDIVPRITFK